MKHDGYKRSLDARARPGNGADGACKALVLGHGGFDPHLALRMSLCSPMERAAGLYPVH